MFLLTATGWRVSGIAATASGPEAGRNMALLLPHGIRINRRGRGLCRKYCSGGHV